VSALSTRTAPSFVGARGRQFEGPSTLPDDPMAREPTEERPRIGLTLQRHLGEGPVPVLVQNVAYFDAIIRAGGVPVGIPVVDDVEAAIAVADSCDGVLLPGGPDVDPAHYGMNVAQGCHVQIAPGNDDRVELALGEWALAADVPMLAVCRGLQVLNVLLGGSLWQDLRVEGATTRAHVDPSRPRSAPAHVVRIEPGTLLSSLVRAEALEVNSIHHQGIRRLGTGVIASGWSEDGLVEAAEVPGAAFCLGVQWHPEEMRGIAHAQALFSGLVHAAARRMREVRVQELRGREGRGREGRGREGRGREGRAMQAAQRTSQ